MNEESYIKKIKTPDGAILSYFQEPGKPAKLHSITGPAIKYPKARKLKDVYAIYGREMSRREWIALKNDTKVLYIAPEVVQGV